MKSFLTIIFSFLLLHISSAQSVIVYQRPPANFGKVSNLYLVSLTQKGITQQTVVYESSAGSGPSSEWGAEENNNFHFALFSFSGAINIKVTKLNSSAVSAVVRPGKLAIGVLNTVSQGANKSVSFALAKPAKLSVEFNDDPTYKNALMIFADTLENPSNVPAVSSSNVFFATDSVSLKNIPANKTIVFFQPGGHAIGHWNIPTNISQVYMAGGAYVIGYLSYANYIKGASIKINGRGILSNEGYTFHYPSVPTDKNGGDWYLPILIKGSQNIMIEGLTLIESTGFNIEIVSGNAVIKNVKINGFRLNNDALILGGSGYNIIDCFFRVDDDTIDLYANNVTVNNCVFWHMNTGAIFQFSNTPQSLANFNISNCYIIHDQNLGTNNNIGFIDAMNAGLATQPADVNNVNVNNVYFDTPVVRFLDIRGNRGQAWTGVTPANQLLWVYRNFKFNNIHLQQGSFPYPLIYLWGYDRYHPLVNFTFQNIYLNNVKVPTSKMNDSTFFNKKGIFGVVIK